MEANRLELNEYCSGHSTDFALSDRPPPAAPPVSHRRVGVFHTLSGCLKRGRKVGARQNPAGRFGNLSFGAIFTLEKIFNKKMPLLFFSATSCVNPASLGWIHATGV